MPPTTPARRLARAALLGGVVGMLLGGLLFLGAGLRRPAEVDCVALPPVACEARRTMEATSARALLAAGCVLLGSGLGFLLLLRREDRRSRAALAPPGAVESLENAANDKKRVEERG